MRDGKDDFDIDIEDENPEPEASEAEELDDALEEESSEGEAEPEDKGEGEEQEELVVVLNESDGEDAEAHDNEAAWIRELRKTNRESKRRIKELEEKLNGGKPSSAPATPEPKPTLADHDYDADAYEAAMTDWLDKKRETEGAWKTKLSAYAEGKSKLKVSDFDEAEEAAVDLLDNTQQALIIDRAKNPALVIYALFKNPAAAKRISGIKDPIDFCFAVAEMEKGMKTETRKPAAAPERKISGAGSKAGSAESKLDKLRAEAEKTGDFTKVIAYKKAMRNSSKP